MCICLIYPFILYVLSLLGLPWWLSGKESSCRRCGFDPWVGKIPGVGYSNPLQYSCQENPMDRGSQEATDHGIAKSWTQLKRLSTAQHTWVSKTVPVTELVLKVHDNPVSISDIITLFVYRWAILALSQTLSGHLSIISNLSANTPDSL